MSSTKYPPRCIQQLLKTVVSVVSVVCQAWPAPWAPGAPPPSAPLAGEQGRYHSSPWITVLTRSLSQAPLTITWRLMHQGTKDLPYHSTIFNPDHPQSLLSSHSRPPTPPTQAPHLHRVPAPAMVLRRAPPPPTAPHPPPSWWSMCPSYMSLTANSAQKALQTLSTVTAAGCRFSQEVYKQRRG